MAVLQCKMCGGSLIPVDSTVCECDSCGTRQTIPNAGDDKKTNLFNRANRLRMNSEFDKAGTIYEQIAAEYPQEAEAYWGLCLCNYGIEYVDDPATGAKMPTCHRTLTTSIMEDSNFEQACDYADTIARKVYRDEAKAIDRIQKDILSIAANEAPYDVFICYKETAEDGGRTEDSVLAQDIYDALTAKGMKVFFSRITLEDKLGVQYEPYIFAALSSARVMLAIGTAFEYYDAVWVKNEWSRFLSMMKAEKTKTLIPCFKGLDAYDMPKEFKGLQAQNMGKLGWMQDLVRGVEKLCRKDENSAGQDASAHFNKNIVEENLLKRAYMFLEDGDTKQAEEYISRALDSNAEYAPAYIAKVVIQNKLTREQDLATLNHDIADSGDIKRALLFATPEQKRVYEQYLQSIAANIEEVENEKKLSSMESHYVAANRYVQNEQYLQAVYEYAMLKDYKDSKELAESTVRLYNQSKIEQEHKKRRDLVTHLQATLNAAEEKLRKEIEDARRSVDAAVKAIEATETRKHKASESIEETQKSIMDMESRINTLTNELGAIRGLFTGGKKKEIQAQIDDLQRKKDALVSNISALEKERTETLKDIQRLKADHESGIALISLKTQQLEQKTSENRERIIQAQQRAENPETHQIRETTVEEVIEKFSKIAGRSSTKHACTKCGFELPKGAGKYCRCEKCGTLNHM